MLSMLTKIPKQCRKGYAHQAADFDKYQQSVISRIKESLSPTYTLTRDNTYDLTKFAGGVCCFPLKDQTIKSKKRNNHNREYRLTSAMSEIF